MSLHKKRAYLILSDILKHKEIEYTINHAKNIALIASACVGVSGLLLGPIGFLAGGIMASVYILINQPKRKMKLIPEILNELSESEKEELLEDIRTNFIEYSYNVLRLLKEIARDANKIERLFEIVDKFVKRNVRHLN